MPHFSFNTLSNRRRTSYLFGPGKYNRILPLQAESLIFEVGLILSSRIKDALMFLIDIIPIQCDSSLLECNKFDHHYLYL